MMVMLMGSIDVDVWRDRDGDGDGDVDVACCSDHEYNCDRSAVFNHSFFVNHRSCSSQI